MSISCSITSRYIADSYDWVQQTVCACAVGAVLNFLLVASCEISGQSSDQPGIDPAKFTLVGLPSIDPAEIGMIWF